MSEMDEYVSMSVLIPKRCKERFSQVIAGRGLKQQHLLANLIVWGSLDDRIRSAYRRFRRINARGQLYDTCISTPRVKRFERNIFKFKVLGLGLGYKNREILIGLIQMVVSKPKLLDEIATFRADEFTKKRVATG